MEIISSSYNCRNPFVAGLLPELPQRKSTDRCPSNSNHQPQQAHNHTHRNRNNLPICTGNTTINNCGGCCVVKCCNLTLPAELNGNKSKKAIRNRRVKEAKRRRRYQKHVHFPEEEHIMAVFILVEDTQEIKDTRQMYWEYFAINRQRFKHRVSRLAEQLERVLRPEHRERIYRERFAEDCVDQLTQRFDSM